MISALGLEKHFSGTVALGGVSFEVGQGKVVGLLGPNGAGKTTCMRILCGFLAPSAGTARVAGHDVRQESLAVRQSVGYLPEGAPLYPELRVSEQLELAARLRGIRRRQRAGEIDTVVERCGLKDMRRRIVGQLSKGYRQRVGLAMALLGSPPLLVLDEPTAGLDPNQIREIRALLRELGGKQTVLLSSHILSEIEAVCEEVLIIDRGRLVAAGTVAEVCADDRSAQLLLRGPREALETLLAEQEGVCRVVHDETVDGAERFIVEGELDGLRCEALAKAVHDAGHGLQELTRGRAGLEAVFARLTRRDVS